MKQLFIFFLFLFIFINANSQSNEIDSLENILKSTIHDTLKARILSDLSFKIRFNNTEKSLEYALKSVELNKKHNLKKGEAKALNNAGLAYNALGMFDKAIEFHTKSIETSSQINDSLGIAKGLINIGYAYSIIGKIEKAIENYSNSLEICLKINDKKLIFHNYNALGNIYNSNGNYDKALESFQNSLNISENLSDILNQAESLNNIGLVFMAQQNNKVALEYFEKARKKAENINGTSTLAIILNNIGIIYDKMNNPDEALKYYLESLKLKEQIGDLYSIVVSYSNIAIIYQNRGDLKKAIEYNTKALKIDEQLNDQQGLCLDYINISEIEKLQKNYPRAIELLEEALKIAKQSDYKRYRLSIYSAFSNIYEMQNDLKSALDYNKKYIFLKDSLLNEESTKQLTEMQTKYESEKKEKEIIVLQKDKEIQTQEISRARVIRNSIIGIATLILFLLIGSYIAYRDKKKANIKLALMNEEILQQKEEIEAQRDLLTISNQEISLQKEEIEAQRDLVTHQKEHIEEIHKEVTDSINYAKRIQEAMLPSLALSTFQKLETFGKFSDTASTRGLIPLLTLETFILFKPKDVVSGDFYWAANVNEWFIACVADCTGHGVPGAFMSMLGISFLNEIVRKKEVTKASEVLNHLRFSVVEALKQTGEMGSQKDGMDISLIAIKTQDSSSKFQIPSSKFQEEESEQFSVISNQSEPFSVISEQSADNEPQTLNFKPQTSNVFNAQWAGANNPLWIIRSTKNLSGLQDLTGLGELKPDNMPVAIHVRMDEFTNHEIILNKSDRIYLFSDGFPDQFGGPKGKKFLSKSFKHLLIETSELSMNEQCAKIEDSLKNWLCFEGKIYEQIDDITVLGIEI